METIVNTEATIEDFLFLLNDADNERA